MAKYDFSGWATRNDLLCGDGRTIRKNAFKQNDGAEVPLVWNHEHNDPNAVLGHAVLENRDDGVYAYGFFNNTEQGRMAKKLVDNGDVKSLSIWANQLKQVGSDVIHGNIRELSLVLAGANPGAYVDFVMAHGADEEDTLYASYDENIMLYHSEDQSEKKGETVGDENKKENDKTFKDVIDSMTEEQQTVMNALIGMALEDGDGDDEDEGDEEMKHNVFDGYDDDGAVLSHADEESIIALAKQSNVGSLKMAMELYSEDHGNLAHGVFEDPENVKTPSQVIFAVPEEYHILLRKAMYLRTYEVTLIPVPTAESTKENPGEVSIANESLKDFINKVTVWTDDTVTQ